MNKFIAKVLSVILLITAISSNYNISIFDEYIYANSGDINFNTSFKKGLEVGPTDSVPIITTTLGENTAWFEWDMNNYKNDEISSGTYILTYPLEDGAEIEFKVNKKLDDEAEIEYRIKDIATGTYKPTESYSIYSHQTGRYELLSNFIDQGYNSAIENYKVVDTRDVALYPADYPTGMPKFIVGPNYGFSFKYNNVSVHFKWYEKQGINKMYFYTNNIKQGYIINPNLNLVVGSNSENYTTILTNGLSSDNFISTPYANDDKKTNDIIEVSNDADKFPANDEQDRGLEIQFNVLKTWDGEKFVNTRPNFKVPATIRFTAVDDSKSMTVLIDDIFEKVTTTTTSSAIKATGFSLDTDNDKVSLQNINNDGDVVSFKLSGLDSGVIFKTDLNVSQDLTIPEDERMESNSTQIEFGQVFTFPKYEVISQNNKLYIVADPFHDYQGEFLLKEGESPERVSSRQQSDGQTQLVFPLSINSQNMFTGYYRLYFSPEKVFVDTTDVDTSNTIHSQKLKYRPTASTDVIAMPNNFYIMDYNHVIDESVSDFSKGFFEVTYRWDIGQKSNIDEFIALNDEMNINYELSKTLTPTPDEIEKVADININIQDSDGDGTLEVIYSGGDDGKTEDGLENYVVNTGVEILQDSYQSDSQMEMYYAQVTLLFKTANLEYTGADSDKIYFRYPNIYFFTVNASMLDDNPINITASPFQSVTLNYLDLSELTPPQNVVLDENTFLSVEDGDARDEVSFNVDFTLSGKAMQDYLKSSYSSDELEKITDPTRFNSYFNIYITEDESNIKDNIIDNDYEQRSNNSEELLYQTSFDNKIYLSDINGNSGFKTDDGKKAIDVLRDGEILKITEYPISKEVLNGVLSTATGNSYSVNFDGFDANTKYYVVLDLIVEDFDRKTLDFSEASPLEAITTKSSLNALKPGENAPNTPNFFEIETEKDTTIMGWEAIIPEKSEDVDIDIEYEIIRLNTSPMPDEYLSSRDGFDTIWNDYITNDDKKGFRTDNVNILEYENGDFVHTDSSLYEYNIDSSPITLRDNTVIPNTIYYYYLRTVKIVDGLELYSVWNRIAVTTLNVEGPINLMALYDDYDSSINLQEEIYLKFDAPIRSLQQLGTEFDLQLAIQKDAEEWQTPITMEPSELIEEGEINEEGYRTFIYKVTGLEPGTSYSFRVRQRIIAQDVNSLYSNTIRIRTEIDQDDYDKEQEVDNWGDYVKDKLEEILNGNYWEINNTSNNKDIVYRETKFDGMLKTVNDGFLNLIDAEPNKNNNYYMPVNSLIKANNQKIGFRIKSDNVTVSLSNNAIDIALNNQIKPLSQSLNDKEIEDYYVKVSVKTENNINKINGNTISSPIIETAIVTKAFDTNIEIFEYEVYEELQSQFLEENLTEDIMEEIEELLDDEKSNEDIIKSLQLDIDKYAEDAMEEIEDMFNDNTSPEKYNRGILSLDSAMIISKPSEIGSNTVGYKKVGENWIKEQTTSYGLSDLIITNTTGTYVFVNTSIIIQDIGNVEDATKAHEILVKYGLYDILKSANGIDADKPITRNEAYSSIAKILGNQNEDATTYLKNLGIDVSTRNLTSSLKEDELVYLLMNIYEYKTNTKIDNYQIKNFSILSNINGVSSKYLKSVQVATDLGIVNLNTFNANNDVTIETFLNTILNVGNKVGI